jgi:magnesium chelatase family protein
MTFYSATLLGVKPLAVEIEIDLSSGLPFFQIVGLPDAILKESKTRVKSAIIQGGYEFPYDQRVVLNLAPSKVRKEGSGFELALAARILASSGQIGLPPGPVMFLGELALDGHLRSVGEIEALAYAIKEKPDVEILVAPAEAAQSLAQILKMPVIGIKHIQDLNQAIWWEQNKFCPAKKNAQENQPHQAHDSGNSIPKLKFSKFWARHLEVAAVGRHHYLVCGPPGCGKTFFAESLKRLFFRNQLETDLEQRALDAIYKRSEFEIPWAAPHHSATAVGLLGGGVPPRPGALTKAHGGILFLDEILEFHPAVLDSLREPIERGFIEIYRAGQQVSFPSRVQIIAAANPCRCGLWGYNLQGCPCSESSRRQYQARMSGPLFDRFDVRLYCQAPMGNEEKVSSDKIRKRVKFALDFKKNNPDFIFTPNAQKYLDLQQDAASFNYRSWKKVQNIAQTLAALDLTGEILVEHLEEAFSFQRLTGLNGRETSSR